jgi:hypothetical protein
MIFSNPHKIFDSLEKDEYYRATEPEFTFVPGKRELAMITYLLDMNALIPPDDLIAKLLLKRENWDQLLALIIRESWGDKGI